MLKKVIFTLLALLVCIALAACNKDEEPENGNDPKPPPTQNDNTPTLVKSETLADTDIVWEIYSDHTMYLKCTGAHSATEPCALPDFVKLMGTENKTDQPWWEHGGKTSTERPSDGGATTVTKLVIGEGITSLGEYAFMDMALLEEVVLPSSLKVISYHSFYNCTQLKTVTGGFGVTHIEAAAFSTCTDLETIELSPNLVEIEEDAFAGCGTRQKLNIKVKGTEIAWTAALQLMRSTQNSLGFPCLADGNTAFEEATITYIS